MSKGEGVILRKDFSIYEHGISKSLLKVKVLVFFGVNSAPFLFTFFRIVLKYNNI